MLKKILLKSFQYIQGSSLFTYMTCLVSVFLLAISFSSQLNLRLDILEQDDAEFTSVGKINELKAEFDLVNNIKFFVGTVNNKSLSGLELCRIKNHLEGIEHKYSFTSLFDLRTPRYIDNKLWYYKDFSSFDCKNSLGELYSSHKNWNGFMWNDDYSSIIIKATFSDSQIIDGTLEKFKRYLNKIQVDNLVVHMGGQSSLKYYFFKSIKKDNLINALIIVVIGLLFFFRYRSLSVCFYSISSLVFSFLLTAGVMGAFDLDITLLNSGLFLMLCLASVQDLIFLFDDYATHDDSFQESLKRQLYPCFLTTLTTVVGFLSLGFSPLSSIQELGQEAAVAAIIEWVAIFLIFPRLIKIPKIYLKHSFSLPLKWNLSRSFYYVLLGCFMLFPFFAKDIIIDESPRLNFSSQHEYTKALAYEKEQYGHESEVVIVFEKNNSNINTIANSLRQIEDIKTVFYWKDLISDKINSLRSPDLRSLVQREMSQTSLLKNSVGKNKEVLLVHLVSHDLLFLNKIISKIKKICSNDCEVVGTPIVYEEFTLKSVSYLKWSLLSCLLLILFLIGSLTYSKTKNLKETLLVMMSSFWGPLVLIGVLGILSIPLQLTNMMILTVLIGLTGDNTIHFISSGKSINEAIGDKGKSSFFMYIFMVCGGSLFLFMDYLPMQKLGMIFILGVSFSFVGDYFIMKKVININEKRNE